VWVFADLATTPTDTHTAIRSQQRDKLRSRVTRARDRLTAASANQLQYRRLDAPPYARNFPARHGQRQKETR
jgi:hypothetical protein